MTWSGNTLHRSRSAWQTAFAWLALVAVLLGTVASPAFACESAAARAAHASCNCCQPPSHLSPAPRPCCSVSSHRGTPVHPTAAQDAATVALTLVDLRTTPAFAPLRELQAGARIPPRPVPPLLPVPLRI